MNIPEQKAVMRAAMEERLERMSEKDRAAESRSICRRLIENIEPGTTVCAYWAFPTEPDLSLLFEELRKRGDRIFLPQFHGNRFEYHEFRDRKELRRGPLGTLEPPDDAPVLDPTGAIVVLIPGRAFDKTGKRIGRGNGGFDIWITKHKAINPQTQCWGVAFDCQIVSAVPVDPHDQWMDAVVTARGWSRSAR